MIDGRKNIKRSGFDRILSDIYAQKSRQAAVLKNPAFPLRFSSFISKTLAEARVLFQPVFISASSGVFIFLILAPSERSFETISS